MTARVSFTIANLAQIRQARYRPPRHQWPVRPLLQPVLRMPVSWSCTLTLTTIMTSMCSIQTTVSRKIAVRCKFNKKIKCLYCPLYYMRLVEILFTPPKQSFILFVLITTPTHQQKFCAKVDIAWMHTRPRYTLNWYKLYAYYMLMSEK